MKAFLIFRILLMTLVTAAISFAVGGDNTPYIFGGLMALKFIPFPTGVAFANAINPYGDTTFDDVRALINMNDNLKFELRRSKHRILEGFIKGQRYLADLVALKTSAKRPTELQFHTRKDFTIRDGVACTIDNGETAGTSKSPVSWATKRFEIYLPTKPFQDNKVNKAEALAMNLINAERSMFSYIESVLYTYLETNRSQVNNGAASLGTWDNTNFLMSIDLANKARFYANIIAQMENNEYNAPFLDFCDSAWAAELVALAEAAKVNVGVTGASQYQYEGFDIRPSNKVIPANGQLSRHYVVPEGGVAIAFWNDKISLDTRQKVTGTRGRYESMLFPGVVYDTKMIDSCTDTTSIGGDTDDDVQAYSFALHFGIAKQELSNEGETPIFKYVVPSTAPAPI